MQDWLVHIIVAFAAAILIGGFVWRKVRGKAAGCPGCGGCDSAAAASGSESKQTTLTVSAGKGATSSRR